MQITKSNNHHHFWIADNVLCESYTTLRGLRWREIIELPTAYDDSERVPDNLIEKINQEFKVKTEENEMRKLTIESACHETGIWFKVDSEQQ